MRYYLWRFKIWMFRILLFPIWLPLWCLGTLLTRPPPTLSTSQPPYPPAVQEHQVAVEEVADLLSENYAKSGLDYKSNYAVGTRFDQLGYGLLQTRFMHLGYGGYPYEPGDEDKERTA